MSIHKFLQTTEPFLRLFWEHLASGVAASLQLPQYACQCFWNLVEGPYFLCSHVVLDCWRFVHHSQTAVFLFFCSASPLALTAFCKSRYSSSQRSWSSLFSSIRVSVVSLAHFKSSSICPTFTSSSARMAIFLDLPKKSMFQRPFSFLDWLFTSQQLLLSRPLILWQSSRILMPYFSRKALRIWTKENSANTPSLKSYQLLRCSCGIFIVRTISLWDVHLPI